MKCLQYYRLLQNRIFFKLNLLHFEDKSFPSFIRKIKSNYWFNNSNGRRDRISFSDITTIEKGIEIIYEKDTGRYFLHYPVDRNWFPEESIFIRDAQIELTKLLVEIDKTEISKDKYILWRKAKNLVCELHWKNYFFFSRKL